MKAWFWLLLGATTVVAALGAWALWRAGAPRLVVDVVELNLGEVNPGERIHRSIALRNTGIRELVIRRVDSSCDCSTPVLSSSRMGKNQTVKLDVEFIVPRGRSSPEARMRVFSNDPLSPHVLRVGGMVSPIFELHPPEISLGEILFEKPNAAGRSFEVRARFPDRCSVEVQDLIAPSGIIAGLVDGANGRPVLNVEVAKQCCIGPLTARVLCTAHDPDAEGGMIKVVKEVRGFVSGPVRAEPNSLVFSANELARLPDIRIRLLPAAGAKLHSARISEITPSLGEIVSCNVATGDEMALVLRAKDDAPSSIGDVAGAVVLAVQSSAGELRVKIPVRVLGIVN